MAEVIIDSSIFIDYLRGHSGADDFLSEQQRQATAVTYAVAYAGVITGARNQREMNRIDGLFGDFVIHEIGQDDTSKSLALLKRFRLSGGVGWLDCLIAAAAIRLGASVATLNEKHFRAFEELRVIRPY